MSGGRHGIKGATVLTFLSLVVVVGFQAAWGKGALARGGGSPMALVQAGKYAEALPGFKAMAKKSPGDFSINYYLGLCAMGVKDYDLAESAFCKVCVAADPSSAFVIPARRQLALLPHRLEPQNAFTNGRLYRWPKGRLLKIFMADGRIVPNTGNGALTSEQYNQCLDLVMNHYSTLKVAPSFQASDVALVTQGIKGWDWAVREKIFSYTWVRDPRQADIIILFSQNKNGYTQYPFGKGQPMLSWFSTTTAPSEQDRRDHMRVIAAHEFGHCLGLGHSNATNDLMKAICIVGDIPSRQNPEALASPSDKASLRALYDLPVDVVF